MLEKIVFNLDPKSSPIRYATLEGRKQIVAPCVMITEGVHSGTNGPGFYSKEENARTVQAWNHKPIVVYHPEIDGKAVSACDPIILDSRKVGVVLNTRHDDKLRTDCWFDYEKTKAVDNRIIDALEHGKMMEVSTGVFIDQFPNKGVWNTEAFEWEARNQQPDHLAVLPDKIGACSIADGGGLLQLNESIVNKYTEGLARYLQLSFGTPPEVLKRCVTELTANVSKGVAIVPVWNELVKNDISYSKMEESVGIALRAKQEADGQYWDGWVCATYPTYVIYCTGGTLWKQDYNITSDGSVMLKGGAIQVVRKTGYETLDGRPVGNSLVSNEDKQMDKKKFVEELITNKQWPEADREWLMGLDEQKLERMKPAPVANAVVRPESVQQQPPMLIGNNGSNGQPVVLTAAEYINACPSPEVKEFLKAGLTKQEEEKQSLIANITSNPANMFSKEFLALKQVPELKALAALAGAGSPTANIGGVTYNGANIGQIPQNMLVTNEEPFFIPSTK